MALIGLGVSIDNNMAVVLETWMGCGGRLYLLSAFASPILIIFEDQIVYHMPLLGGSFGGELFSKPMNGVCLGLGGFNPPSMWLVWDGPWSALLPFRHDVLPPRAKQWSDGPPPLDFGAGPLCIAYIFFMCSII